MNRLIDTRTVSRSSGLTRRQIGYLEELGFISYAPGRRGSAGRFFTLSEALTLSVLGDLRRAGVSFSALRPLLSALRRECDRADMTRPSWLLVDVRKPLVRSTQSTNDVLRVVLHERKIIPVDVHEHLDNLIKGQNYKC